MVTAWRLALRDENTGLEDDGLMTLAIDEVRSLWLYPPATELRRCPGRLSIDPHTGIADGGHRSLCPEMFLLDWQRGESGRDVRCADPWCGFAGLLTRGPTTLPARLRRVVRRRR